MDGNGDELTFDEAVLYIEGMMSMDWGYNVAADMMTR